jgi:hypothetical protein
MLQRDVQRALALLARRRRVHTGRRARVSHGRERRERMRFVPFNPFRALTREGHAGASERLS